MNAFFFFNEYHFNKVLEVEVKININCKDVVGSEGIR